MERKQGLMVVNVGVQHHQWDTGAALTEGERKKKINEVKADFANLKLDERFDLVYHADHSRANLNVTVAEYINE
jgi:hypothetical protein